MSIETLGFLLGLISQVNLSAGDPNFEKNAASVVRAKAELEAAISAADKELRN